MYVELHSASAFSFLRGASLPEEMAGLCAALGMPAMALLDRDGVYGSPRFHMAAKKAGVRAHIGAEVTLRAAGYGLRAENPPQRHRDTEEIESLGDRAIGRFKDCSSNSESNHPITQSFNRSIGREPTTESRELVLPLLAANRTGYQNLCRLITRMKMRAGTKHVPAGVCAALEHDLAEHAPGLICLTGGDDGPLAAALERGGIEAGRAEVERLAGIFGRENVYVELQRHYTREEEARNQAAVEIARALQLPLLATNGVRYAQTPQREVLDIFTCIHHHRNLDTAGRLLARNSERHIKPAAEMVRLFADLPDAIGNTRELSARLEFTLADLGYEFPRYPVPQGETMMGFLRARTYEGARRRYRPLGDRARRQLERELTLIERLDLAGYFLIVWDLVEFCRREGILVQGRGSAANSAVCYSLGITAVDPVGMDLLFERFLSEERGEWPDIDLDLPSGDQRERVIQYVYQRYGKLGAAMTANVITYRGKSAAREVGKSLGFDAETLDRLSGLVSSWEYQTPTDTLEHSFRNAGYALRHPRIRKFLELCLAVQDLPRHLGQHSGGMVICQGQLDSVVPLEPASMPGRVVVQWDKDDCADLGLIKVDLLGLGMMAVLEDTIRLIRESSGEEVDLAHLPADDPEVYAALQKADTVGMFQIESRAQMSCLPRLRPKCFYDIVVQVAIIRPGPIVGNMVNPYLKRRQGREAVAYAHPALEPVLERTLGVPLFQEQLLRMAMITAGFSGGEAEELRRAFGFKRSEKRMAEIEQKLRRGMEANGIRGKAQDEIIQAITSFALYGFPESHAASFALIAYASAYLKTHYLAAFTAAMLNNQPMGFYHPSTLVKDAQRHGLKIRPVDVTRSEWECTLEDAAGYALRAAGEKPTTESQRHREIESLSDRVIESLKNNDSITQSPDHSIQSAEGRRPTTDGFPTENRKPKTENVLRLGLRYVKGLRMEAAQALVRARQMRPFGSVEELARRVPELHKDELVMLANVGALNQLSAVSYQPSENPPQRHRDTEKMESLSDCVIESLNPVTNKTGSNHSITQSLNHSFQAAEGRGPTTEGFPFHRRTALWQVERATRPTGPLLDEEGVAPREPDSPLAMMTAEERLVADFRGTGLTVGPHPMAYHRARMNTLRVKRAAELEEMKNGSRARVAGCVIARQRPGTAHGFVFLSLEDESGIANAIITPDMFERHRFLITEARFLLIDGQLQNLDNVISVKADNVETLPLEEIETSSHDFH